MTKQIQVGGVPVGGGAPVSIQSMTNTRTDDVEATLSQIRALDCAGCEIVRVAVPDLESARAVGRIKEDSPLPVVVDIHFDYKLALEAIAAGADKVRINPGNIGGEDRVKAVADACRRRNIPIRVGVNGGSLEKAVLAKYGRICPEAMVESAFGHIRLLNRFDFDDICVSLKSSSVSTTMKACQLMAQESDYPLHIGVTEAGTEKMGTLKSAIGIGGLLALGIGDTMRVSLSADPVREVYAARDILKAAGIRREGAELVSCPTCGRTRIDLISLANEV
ncbi:MAG: flavodoxin-dependent (E)-4-hydroxy-3-methylbut-2-enyl-diphosphate synthase, partial [Lawsonibacter sp.]